MDRWYEMQVFVQAADLGSLTKAAQQLNISTSAASRMLASLEQRLDARLVQRTTRRLSLTEAGERFLVHSRDLLSGLDEAEASVSEIVAKPGGTLRISASLSFCLLHIEPLLPRFSALYPDISLDLIASNRYYDIIENGVDLAIRTRRVEADSSVTIRKLAETRRLLVASPDYLARRGHPMQPSDLARHDVLLYTLADHHTEFRFTRDDRREIVTVKPSLTTNDGQILRRAAVDGMGIIAQPTYIVDADLGAGALVRVLDDWDLPRLTVNLAYPSRAHLPAKVRLFIDFLATEFREQRYEERWTR